MHKSEWRKGADVALARLSDELIRIVVAEALSDGDELVAGALEDLNGVRGDLGSGGPASLGMSAWYTWASSKAPTGWSRG